MLKGHLPRVIYHTVYYHAKKTIRVLDWLARRRLGGC